MTGTEKPASERLLDLARAINAIDFRAVMRQAVGHYNQQMRAINGDKPTH